MSPVVTYVLVALLVASCASTVGLAVYAVRRRADPGATPLLGLLVSLSVWSGFYTISLLLTDFDVRLLFERLQWLGIPFVGVCMFWFAVVYTGHDRWLSRRRLAGLFVVPAVTVALVWTNHSHHLVWTDQTVVVTAGIVLAEQKFGLWYWLHFVYAYGLVALGSLLLLGLIVRSEYLYLEQSVLLLVGIAAPVVGNAISVFVQTPLPGIDLTPYALTVTGISFGVALFRYRLFDLAPATRQIGRNAALRDLEDGIVIVDDDHTVIYCNRAGAEILAAEPSAVIGDPLDDRFGTSAIELGSDDSRTEIEVAESVYEIRASPVTDPQDRQIGHTLMLVDVTERKRHERAVADQRDALQTLDEINRIIRNVHQALLGTTTREQIETAVTRELADSTLYDGACLGLGATAEHGLTCAVGDDSIDGHTDGGEDAVIAAIRATDGVTAPPQRPQPLDVPDDARLDDTGRWTTVSLAYDRTVYGVLVVYTTRENAFDKRELAVLEELGQAIGYAINAVENRQLLLSDAVTEVTLAVTDEAARLAGLSERLGVVLELQGVVPLSDDQLLVYLAIDGDAPETVVAALADAGVEAARIVAGDVIECRLGSQSPLVSLVAYGANVRAMTVESGRANIRAEIAPDASPRTLVETMQAAFPETTMLSKSQRAPGDTDRVDSEGVLDDLTDRQRDVLEAAYRSGYFGWPRDSTAEEVATSLDITSPTLHNHLRKAEAKIMQELLDDTER